MNALVLMTLDPVILFSCVHTPCPWQVITLLRCGPPSRGRLPVDGPGDGGDTDNFDVDRDVSVKPPRVQAASKKKKKKVKKSRTRLLAHTMKHNKNKHELFVLLAVCSEVTIK